MGSTGLGVRVAIDATPAMKAERTGVAHYVRNLVLAMKDVAGPEDRFQLLHRMSRWGRREFRLDAPDERFTRRWMQGALRPRGIDVTHGPDGRLLEAGTAGRVVTIHDVFALEEDGEGTSAWRKKMEARYQAVADGADIVLCVSAWTRNRFLNFHPEVDVTRVRVVPHGVSRIFSPDAASDLPTVRRFLGLEGPYALFVGALVERKNPAVLIDAWAMLPDEAPRLVFAGPDGGLLGTLREKAEKAGVASRVHFAGHVDDAFMPALLAGATCLVFPSRMEGFGLPALEALASGTPVVHSGRGALREATGNHAIEIDPDDPASVAGGVLRTIDDMVTRDRLRGEGLAYASRFGWDRAALLTLQAYRDAAALR